MEREKTEKLSARLARFFDGPDSKQQAEQAILSALSLSPDLNVAQVFNTIACRRGAGKSHCSGKPEGKMKGS